MRPRSACRLPFRTLRPPKNAGQSGSMYAPLLGVCVELLAPAALVGVGVLLLGASPSELLASGAALWSGFIHYAKPRERSTRLITRTNATAGATAVGRGLI